MMPLALLDDLLSPIFDHWDLFLVGFTLLSGALLWWRVSSADAWIVTAHRAVRVVLAVAVLGVLYNCEVAFEGTGERVGSKSVGVRASDGVAVHLSTRVDTRVAPSSRLLSERGITSVASLPNDEFRWGALRQVAFEVPIAHPPAFATPVVLLAGAVSLLPWFMGLLAVERILRRARSGDPFSRRNVRDLRWLAFAASGAIYLAIVVDYLVATWVQGDQTGIGLMLGAYSETVDVVLTFPLAPLLIGALILALAEVWRAGINLQDDVEATV